MKRHALSARRKMLGFSQETIAKKLGVNRSTVSRWENGTGVPLPLLRPGLARLLQISIEELDQMFAPEQQSAVEEPGTTLRVERFLGLLRHAQFAWIGRSTRCASAGCRDQ